jgi:hypothetical protein
MTTMMGDAALFAKTDGVRFVTSKHDKPFRGKWVTTLPSLSGGHRRVKNVISSTVDDLQLLDAWHNRQDAEAFRILCERYAGLIDAYSWGLREINGSEWHVLKLSRVQS